MNCVYNKEDKSDSNNSEEIENIDEPQICFWDYHGIHPDLEIWSKKKIRGLIKMYQGHLLNSRFPVAYVYTRRKMSPSKGPVLCRNYSNYVAFETTTDSNFPSTGDKDLYICVQLPQVKQPTKKPKVKLSSTTVLPTTIDSSYTTRNTTNRDPGNKTEPDCPEDNGGVDPPQVCSNITGEFVANCTFLNCSEPMVNVKPVEASLPYITEWLAKCENDGDVTLKLLLDIMNKQKPGKNGLFRTKDANKMKKQVKTMIGVFDRLLDKDAVVWGKMKEDKRILTSMEIIRGTEEAAWMMGCMEENMTIKKNNLAVEVFKLDERNKTLQLNLSSSNVGDVELPDNLIVAKTENTCQENGQRGVVTAYTNVESYLAPENNFTVTSSIIGVNLGGELNTTQYLSSNKTIKIKFYHSSISYKVARPVCVFLNWNYVKKESKYGIWDTEGCSMVANEPLYTICECSHLTNFAILMNFAGEEPNERDAAILSALSLFCNCLSSIALLLTVIIYTTIKSFRSRRNTITCNLAACLLAMNVLVQTGLDRVATVVCKVVSGLLQYFVLSAFFWMLLEGVLLYRMVITVFETKRVRSALLFLIGYGIPFIIVASSSAMHPEEMIRQKFCWPSNEKGLIWSVLGPILLVLTVNIIIFGMTLKAASKINELTLTNVSIETRKKNLMQRLKGAMSLACLLGFTWLVGFFYVPNTSVAAYLFVVLNGLQGVFLFLTQIVFNDHSRKKLFTIYKENVTKLTSSSGAWNFLVGKAGNPKGHQAKQKQESTSIHSSQNDQDSTVRPSAPPPAAVYCVPLSSTGRGEDVHVPHPFGVNY